MLLTSIDQKKYCWVAFLKNCGNPLHLLYWATKAGRDKSKHNHIQNKVRHAVFVSGQPKVKLNRNFQSQFRNKLRKNRLGRNFSADLIIQQLYIVKQLLWFILTSICNINVWKVESFVVMSLTLNIQKIPCFKEFSTNSSSGQCQKQ